jgi:hypothetical protein
MRELRSAEIADRRVLLVVDEDGHYTVTIEVWTEAGWQDISLLADRHLPLREATARFDRRLAEHEGRYETTPQT